MIHLLSFLAFIFFLWHAHWRPKQSQSWAAWRWREASCVSWRGGRYPSLHPHGSLISPNNSSKIITRTFAWLETELKMEAGAPWMWKLKAASKIYGPWHIPVWRDQWHEVSWGQQGAALPATGVTLCPGFHCPSYRGEVQHHPRCGWGATSLWRVFKHESVKDHPESPRMSQ